MPSPNTIDAVYLIHPDPCERDRLQALIVRHGFSVLGFSSAEAFLSELATRGRGCLVVDLQSPRAFELLERLRADAAAIPTIIIAEAGNVPAAVRAMRAGASAFLEKPYARSVLIREIRRFFEWTN